MEQKKREVNSRRGSETHPIRAAKRMKKVALAGVAQWIEHGPANKGVAGLILSRGTCLGCGPGPQ